MSTPVPILDLKAQYATIKDEIHAAIERVLESQHFILGPEVEALEKEIAAYCQCKYATAVSSGTDALLLALMTIGLKPGDEVITTPYSFFATAGSIVRLGGVPVFVDIDPHTYNIQAESVEAAVTPRTRAIIPVHLAGQVANMGPILETARRHNLIVIEDACQAIGADYHGQRAGSIGHLGCFSFFPSKNLGGYGDSGMVTTNDAELADRLNLLRNHGHRPKYYNKAIGGNFRMDALQAAILRAKFPHLEGWTEARRRHAETYRKLFSQAGLAIQMEDLGKRSGIVLPQESAHGRHIYHLFIIRLAQRDALQAFLKERQIGSEVYYPVPLHLQECFAERGWKPGDYPQSEQASRQTLALPVYPEMTAKQQEAVVEAISAFFDRHYA